MTYCFCAVALALSIIATAPIAPAIAQTATAAQQSPRDVTALSDGWRFQYGVQADAVTGPAFDDSKWEAVSVPHSWNRVGSYTFERAPTSDNRQGVGWYRLRFAAPPAAKNRRHYLDFAAVGSIADVWVNGIHVGEHKGAFSRFRFDVTAQWKPGATNLIAVKADNSKPAIGSPTQDVLPLAGDFFIHGGLYRGVALITANEVGIDLLDYAGPGVYARGAFRDVLGDQQRFRTIDGTEAHIPILVRLRNAGKSTRRLDIAATVRDAAGQVVAQDVVQSTLKGKTTAEANLRPAIVTPHLWNGVSDPYEYSVTITATEKGRLVDEVMQPLGIRTFNFEPDTGLLLNGKPLKLHGVSRHQDRMGKGYALTRADHKEDMDLIAEMGANAVRMAHYQHDDAWADEADAHGMIAWAEVPYVTTPSLNGGEGSAALFANAEQQTRELIRQSYNHPSIMMWSVGNEVDAASLFGASKEPVKPLKLLQRIAAVAREEDPTRPTIFADCCEDVSSLATKGEPLAGAADMIGYNRYYGWYYPQPLKAAEQLATQLDNFHIKHPTLPISISEYGAGGAISQHSDNPVGGFVNAIGRPQPEEYESWVHEQSWPAIRDRAFIFGSFVWNMFDFASDLRNEGASVDINTKGLVTFDRKTKKDAYYYYQANWTSAPMVHITGKRYVDRAYPATDVRAYSNAPSASLSVNGKTIGEAPCPGHICGWRNVLLKPGANTVVATISATGQTISDNASWNGPDPAKGINIDVGDLSGRLLGVRRFGSDTFFTGGAPAVLNQTGFGGRRSGPPKVVSAPDPALYDYWREGEAFSYAIPVPNGKWTVTIHSFEPRASASPTMTVMANGKVAIPAFSVSNAAGGPLRGLSRSFTAKINNGVLLLDFSATGGKAVVAAIEITPITLRAQSSGR